eukprot:7964705-Alexandrium_andersonii.AAC.1
MFLAQNDEASGPGEICSDLLHSALRVDVGVVATDIKAVRWVDGQGAVQDFGEHQLQQRCGE